MTASHVSPSIEKTAFSCPYCGAFTTQHWFSLYANPISNKRRVPFMPDEVWMSRTQADKDVSDDVKERLKVWGEQMMRGEIIRNRTEKSTYLNDSLDNLNIAECYNCKKIAVWVNKSIVFPATRLGPEPNQDLPDEIMRDFEEARTILNNSPRGSAALLRLSIQKLCAFLGEKGRNIDDDIASLVGKGLNPIVQQSLDVVRVIGNEAVHPGVIDLRDDQNLALQLLSLVNIIAEQMITHPKLVTELYKQLPENKKDGIETRNKNAINAAKTAPP